MHRPIAQNQIEMDPAKAGGPLCNKLGASVEMDSRLRGKDNVAETMNQAFVNNVVK